MKEIKSKVLEELMSLMDEQEGENLKLHPKLVAAKITVAKPIGKVIEAKKDDEDVDDDDMMSMANNSELEDDDESCMPDLSSMSPAMKTKLLKLLSKA